MPTTGNALLLDTGILEYNSVLFSVLYRSEITGEIKQDQAGRTVMVCEYTLSAEGICSEAAGTSLETNFVSLRKLLEQDGAQLIYTGRGFGNLTVNPVVGGAGGFVDVPGGSTVRDVAWGPKPELLYFQPLGNGLSAMVKWRCKFAISEETKGGDGILQFSYSYGISFDEDFYSQLSFKGVIEVPLTRTAVGDREIPPAVADSFRRGWLSLPMDLTQYRVKSRNFNESADRRKIDWDYSFEELPPMNLPPGAPRARGTFDVQPMRTGSNKSIVLLGVMWSCNLKVTYTIRADFPRRQAVWMFLLLLQFRMNSSRFGLFPPMSLLAATAIDRVAAAGAEGAFGGVAGNPAQPLLTSFSFHEGIHLDSRTFTCEASWALFTTFRTLLDATGVWRWPEGMSALRAAASLDQVAGWRTWQMNNFNTDADAIVDFGGGDSPFGEGPPPPTLTR